MLFTRLYSRVFTGKEPAIKRVLQVFTQGDVQLRAFRSTRAEIHTTKDKTDTKVYAVGGAFGAQLSKMIQAYYEYAHAGSSQRDSAEIMRGWS